MFSKSTYSSILIICTVALCLVSCKKKNTVADVTNITVLSVYNFSPTVATYDAYLNDTRINSAALPFGGGIKYQQFKADTYSVNFNIATTSTNILKKSFSFPNAGGTGTLYLIGKKGTFDAFYVDDSGKNTNTGKAYVRFLNVCADAPPMSLDVKDGATLAKDQAFKSNSTFTEVDPGTFTFLIKETGSGTVKTQITGGVLSAGNFYTIAVGGNYAPVNDDERPVTGFLILHK